MAGFTILTVMSDLSYHELLETRWRRALTEAEQARLQALLAADPALAADWQAELALGRILQRLPEPSLSSNFTAQVMRAVETGADRAQAWPGWSWSRHWVAGVWPKLAWSAALILLVTATLYGYQRMDRTRLVRDLAQLPAVETLPAPEVLRDFDAIQQLSFVALPAKEAAVVSDDDLVKALQ